MEIGLKKLHENEWQIHIGYCKIRLDHFSTELLDITLEHALALDCGKQHSTLESYIKLGLRLLQLSDVHIQKTLRNISHVDLLNLMLIAKNPEFNETILKNIGGILSKQLSADLEKVETPDRELAKDSIRRIVEMTYKLESQGEIEFINDDVTEYI